MNKYKVKMYESLDDMKENYLTDQFIVISDGGQQVSYSEIEQMCLKRRNENEGENNKIEDFVWDIENYADDDIEVIDLRKGSK